MNKALDSYHYNQVVSIAAVLVSEGAVDLSDAELERCLKHCAAGWVSDAAKQYRDKGDLTYGMVERLRNGTFATGGKRDG